jgi:CBS-domain-containing membrane protein
MEPTSVRTVRVRDIMTAEVVTAVANTAADEAARSLSFHKVSAAPVLEHGTLVGIVSKSDLVDPRRRGAPGSAATVADVMTRVVYAVRPGDPAMMAVRMMLKQNVHRALVVNDSGRLVGIVSAIDVLRALAQGARLQEAEEAHHGAPAVAVDPSGVEGCCPQTPSDT